ncbi:MAG: radical SAM family heme chaperone HemW [bacterium]
MSCSLYLHIPFCRKKCNYCDFPSYAGRESLMPDYIEALKAELGYYSSVYDRPSIRTIYVGGGTPTLLPDELISSLFGSIQRDFDVSSGAEVTFEANPGTVTKEKLKTLIDSGVNRISLGAQIFNDPLLKKLGRIHLEHEIVEAYELIREAGFKNVNLDLMFALPGGSINDWQDSLVKAVKLNPEHISTYNLQIEEGTPFYNEKLEGALLLPEEEDELKMYKIAIAFLKENGYKQYEISNFAREGFECAHNIVYWTMKDYIGIGAGAHSFINNTRVENSPYLEKYLSKDFSSIKTEHVNTKKESMQEMLFLSLRLIKGFHLNDFTRRFGIGFREIYKKELAELTDDGLLEMAGKNVRLTEKGLFLANEVFKKFL